MLCRGDVARIVDRFYIPLALCASGAPPAAQTLRVHGPLRTDTRRVLKKGGGVLALGVHAVGSTCPRVRGRAHVAAKSCVSRCFRGTVWRVRQYCLDCVDLRFENDAIRKRETVLCDLLALRKRGPAVSRFN